MILVALVKIRKICRFSALVQANMDANTLNYWLIKFVQEVANSQRKVTTACIQQGTLVELSVACQRHLQQTEGSQALTPIDASDKR